MDAYRLQTRARSTSAEPRALINTSLKSFPQRASQATQRGRGLFFLPCRESLVSLKFANARIHRFWSRAMKGLPSFGQHRATEWCSLSHSPLFYCLLLLMEWVPVYALYFVSSLRPGQLRRIRDIHTRGVIHGDISPNNFCVSASLTKSVVKVSLIDFGGAIFHNEIKPPRPAFNIYFMSCARMVEGLDGGMCLSQDNIYSLLTWSSRACCWLYVTWFAQASDSDWILSTKQVGWSCVIRIYACFSFFQRPSLVEGSGRPWFFWWSGQLYPPQRDKTRGCSNTLCGAPWNSQKISRLCSFTYAHRYY